MGGGCTLNSYCAPAKWENAGVDIFSAFAGVAGAGVAAAGFFSVLLLSLLAKDPIVSFVSRVYRTWCLRLKVFSRAF